MAQAELALRRAIMARPDLAPAKLALSIVLYQLALPLHGAKRLLEAEANIWEALALRPDFAEAAHFLAVSSRHPSRVLPDVPDPQATSAAREALSLLQIADVVDGTLIRVGQRADGGYVMLDLGLTEAVAYSLGIGGNISWDEAMAERGCRLFQYDHSIEKVPKEHPNFHWFRLGVTGQEGERGPFMTLAQMLANNGHLGRRDLILKTDIEGAEWEMLIHLADDVLQQFSQITGEFHDFVGIGNPDRRDKILAGLRRLTKFHQVIHVHANSVGTIGIIGGVPLADLLEITLVRRADHVFLPTTKRFPTALDAPNSPGQLDYALDLLGFSGGSVFDA